MSTHFHLDLKVALSLCLQPWLIAFRCIMRSNDIQPRRLDSFSCLLPRFVAALLRYHQLLGTKVFPYEQVNEVNVLLG